MNFGQNLYNWFLSNAQSLVLMAIVVIGVSRIQEGVFKTYRVLGDCLDCCRSGIQCRWRERCAVAAF